MTKAPKCRFCGKEHYRNCAPAKERAVGRLAQLEIIIERGKRAFIEMGQALIEIRDKRLYREQGHKTFEDYCQTRWGFTSRRANQLIEGTDAAGLLGTKFPKLANEAQARELTKLAKTEGSQAVSEVMERIGPKPTAAKIRKAVQERTQPELEPTYEIEPPCSHRISTCDKCGEKVKSSVRADAARN